METIARLHDVLMQGNKSKTVDGSQEKRFRLSASNGMDEGDFDSCLMLDMLPQEIHFVILSNMQANELIILSQTCKDIKGLVEDDLLWKRLYIEKWLQDASDSFISKYFPKTFEWREMYKTRVSVEKKYLSQALEEMAKRNRHESLATADTGDWKSYLRKGKLLAKHETEDLDEFVLLAAIEQEEYKSAAALANKEKDKKLLADIYYYWGRCIKDLSRNKNGESKLDYLLAEEDKYQTAFSLEPTDSYILYSWAINLRFQLEFVDNDKSVEVYRNSSKKYREALGNGYIQKYVLWGLGSLKLHMAKKNILNGDFEAAKTYLDKAEKKYAKLQSLWEEGDSLTAFSLCFNYSCIYSCRAKIPQNTEENFQQMCIDKLKECCKTDEFMEYLTLDLLDLWYFDHIRNENWFQAIKQRSKPKKLNASW